MNLFYPVNTASKACWVFDAIKHAWPNAKKVNNYQWTGGDSAFWGLVGDSFNLIKRHQNQKIPFLFTDMPYWSRYMPDSPRQQAYWRTIPNALHCNWLQTLDDKRFKKLNITVGDWKKSGKHILVCPSSPTIERFYGEEYWLDRTIEKLKTVTDRPIKIRLKPRNNVTSGPAAAQVPLEQDLRDAHAIVTLVSIAAVDAVTFGVPSFCSIASAAATVSSLDLNSIEHPVYPDRTNWLNTLSYHQYTEEEIRSGLCYDFLKPNFGDMK